jgi:hypothetical protein
MMLVAVAAGDEVGKESPSRTDPGTTLTSEFPAPLFDLFARRWP